MLYFGEYSEVIRGGHYIAYCAAAQTSASFFAFLLLSLQIKVPNSLVLSLTTPSFNSAPPTLFYFLQLLLRISSFYFHVPIFYSGSLNHFLNFFISSPYYISLSIMKVSWLKFTQRIKEKQCLRMKVNGCIFLQFGHFCLYCINTHFITPKQLVNMVKKRYQDRLKSLTKTLGIQSLIGFLISFLTCVKRIK